MCHRDFIVARDLESDEVIIAFKAMDGGIRIDGDQADALVKALQDVLEPL